MSFPIELENIHLFDVLRNSLSGELGIVMGVEGDKVALKLKTGEIARFKHGEHLFRVSEDEAVAFREVIAEQRRQATLLKPRKRGSLRKPVKKVSAKKKK